MKNVTNTLNITEMYIGLYILEKTYVLLWLWAFTELNHVIGHKENINKFQKVEVLEAMFFAHHPIKLEISSVQIDTLN